jgi:hypothetical protein
LISDVANVARAECDECLGPTRGRHELNLEAVRPINLDNRSKVSSPQTSGRDVTRQDNGVENIEHGLPRESGHQTWKVLLRTNDPHRPNRNRSPRWRSQNTIDFKHAPIVRSLLVTDASGSANGEDVIAEQLPLIRSVAQ